MEKNNKKKRGNAVINEKYGISYGIGMLMFFLII